jgi:L-alanine-DL-glutamate epimerase-like enolase superfamily enzyme
MKITNLIGYSLSSPYGDGNVYGQPQGVKSIGIVEVHTNSGHIGIGETYSGVYVPELISPVVEFLKSIIIGHDPFEIEIINESLKVPFVSGSGLVKSIISAIDISLWDIQGQVQKKPISELLNTKLKNGVKVYASGGSVAMSDNEICDDVEKILQKGFFAYKMRVGLQTWENDLKRVATARKILGAKNELMIDAIMGTLPNSWHLKTAEKRAQDLVQYRPFWLEEPLVPDNYFGYKSLKAKTTVPIAMGESFTGLHEFEAYLSGNCVDYIQPDVTQCGGYSQAIKIISVSKNYNIPVALHVWGSAISIMANLHLARAFSEVEWLEIPQVRLEILSDKINEQLTINDGFVSAPDEPGLGLSISEALKNIYPFVPGSGYRVPPL